MNKTMIRNMMVVPTTADGYGIRSCNAQLKK